MALFGRFRQPMARGTLLARPTLCHLEGRVMLDCNVASLADTGANTLRACIADANNNPGPDTITFDSHLSGTITLQSALPDITSEINIAGLGSDDLAVDGANAFRVFTVTSTGNATVSGLTIQNGRSPGGAGPGFQGGGIHNSGNLAIEDSVITGNVALVQTISCQSLCILPRRVEGGGIYNASGASLLIRASDVINNRAESVAGLALPSFVLGGGIYNAGDLKIEGDSSVTGNTASGTLTDAIASLSLIGGGGIYNAPGASVEVVGSAIRDNEVYGGNANHYYGAGIFNGGAGNLSIDSSSITENLICALGRECNGDTGAERLEFNGAGIYNEGYLTVGFCTIARNMARGTNPADTNENNYRAEGGGVFSITDMTPGFIRIDSSTISDNQVLLDGIGGQLAANGAGVSIYGTTTLIENSTIAENSNVSTATSEIGGSPRVYGGGIYVKCTRENTPLTIRWSTIASNSAGTLDGQAHGGGLFVNPIDCDVSTEKFDRTIVEPFNTIFADNVITGPTTSGPDIQGYITSQGYNLIGDPSGGSGYIDHDIQSGHAALGKLKNNGGMTETMALGCNSDALDAGDADGAPNFDQRGKFRIVNAKAGNDEDIDIGALEAQSVPPCPMLRAPTGRMAAGSLAAVLLSVTTEHRLNSVNAISGLLVHEPVVETKYVNRACTESRPCFPSRGSIPVRTHSRADRFWLVESETDVPAFS